MSPLPLLAMLATGSNAAEPEDPNLWLEDVTGEDALSWVRERNATTAESLGSDAFDALQQSLLEVYDSDDRIPYVGKRGDWYYNFWKDGTHPRGLWRRTTLDSWRTDAPEWDVLLDLDALAEEEEENWVWHGARCLRPAYDRCLVSLSRGGADADVTREFDVPSLSFVEGGFFLPEAKGGASWIDRDTVYVSTDFGEGTMTDSGYPRVVKEWKRGTDLKDARVVFEGETQDISVSAWRDDTPGFERDFVHRGLTFYSSLMFERTKKGLVQVDKPDDASAWVHRDWLLIELRTDWEVDGTTYASGSLLAAPYDKWMKGKKRIEVIFEPTETTSLAGTSATKNHLLLNVLDDVKNRVFVLTPGKKGWTRVPLEGLPEIGDVSVSGVDEDESDAYWVYSSDFLNPASVALGEIDGAAPETMKQLPAFFDADGMAVSQHFATSEDGTRVPYFQVSPKGMELDGTNPTLLYGYGGFEVSMTPFYSAGIGRAWLSKGGVYVLANIRGGGEYGPRWHQAALKENRHRAYEDFVAVAKDLVDRGVTTREKLGAQGGSNGGLLMGNMYTLYPEVFGAIVCQVPLLDMKRYHKLLAGASWMGEYGDPDNPDEWAFIKGFSPYHNIDPAKDHPPILIMTSTRDDRVHPGHARKMTARLLDYDKDVLYYENIEGGHGGAANNEQAAHMGALAFRFLWTRLTGEGMTSTEGEAGNPDGEEASASE